LTATITAGAPGIALWVLTGLAATMFLRTAHELLIPIVIAVLISYALEPLVARLEHVRVPRLLGAALVLLLLVGGAGLGLYALRDELKEAMNALPEATRRAGEFLGVTEPARQAQEVTRSPAVLQRGVGWVLSGAGHLTVVIFLVYFLLISGEHFKRRFIELAGSHLERRRIAINVLDDINEQIQRFLIVRALTSAIVGVATWAALAVMDVRQAAVWGILAGVFNSIPYFGPVIVSGGLLVVGFLQFGEPMAALKIAAIALAITSLEGWLLEPPLLGKAERMHVVVVFLGVLLWTWLWGAWGTILAVPMLAVVKSICDHVEPFAPVSRLLAP
jgi:predicted PurR-regulated permease PerM